MLTVLDVISKWAIPLMLIIIPLVGLLRGVRVYESFVEGAREGLHTGIRILPFLIAMFLAIHVFRKSGALDYLTYLVSPLTNLLSIPEEILPLAMIRPLSGSGALAMLADMLATYGADSFLGRLASTLQGSTETTFYVITVYFGAVGIRKVRHSLISGLAADLAGFLAALYIVRLVFG